MMSPIAGLAANGYGIFRLCIPGETTQTLEIGIPIVRVLPTGRGFTDYTEGIMKTTLALFTTSILVLSASLVLASPAAAQEHGRSPQAGGRTTERGARPAQNRPRANQGRIPKGPPARSNPAEERQAEHLPTGHVNDLPHVNHGQWFGHDPANDARFHMDNPFSHGRFAHVGPTYRYRVTRVDANLHRFWLPSGSFAVADWDWAICEDWCWDCGDDFVVYDDPDHPGWNLLYNVHTGVYVHVQYMGR